jgi:hypothetical protein
MESPLFGLDSLVNTLDSEGVPVLTKRIPIYTYKRDLVGLRMESPYMDYDFLLNTFDSEGVAS